MAKQQKNVIIRLIIVAIGVCHDNSAKADLRHLSHWWSVEKRTHSIVVYRLYPIKKKK
jgi:hypothetical protein